MAYDIRAWWTDLLWGIRNEEPPLEYMQFRASIKIGELTLRLLRMRCWFIGHDEVMGEQWNYEPDYCSRCYAEWPSETTTLPTYLTKEYCWLVERDWKWFNYLDEWLFNHLPRKWWPEWARY